MAVVGGGVFGSLYLAQARRTPASTSSASPTLHPERVRERLLAAGWPDAALRRTSAEDARRHGTTWLTDGRRGADRRSRRRGRDRGDGGCAGGSRPRAVGDRGRPARRHGRRRGRRPGRPVARAPGRGSRRRLHAGLRRPAGADLRARRVGAAERLRGRLRRQGHQAPPRLPRVTPDSVWEHYGLPPEQGRGPQRADVLLLPRRHQVGRRDGRGRECDRPRAAGARPRLPALRHRRARGTAAAGARGRRARPAAARSKWSRACTQRLAGWRDLAGACTSRSPPPTVSSRPRSPPTASRRRATVASLRSGGRRTSWGSSSA